MEALNQSLFLWINASDPTVLSLMTARFLANGLVYLFPAYLVVDWLRADTAGREALLQAALTLVLALAFATLIRHFWFHPRPFTLPLGHQYAPHAANASFPSNHLSFIWGLCAGLMLHPARRRAGWVLGLIGLSVAWARIYLGVHWPLDMAGALAIALLSAWLLRPLRPRAIPALRRAIEPLYRRVFCWPIKKGWVRA